MIEKVHGINATCLTLDERFTQLASASVIGPRRRPSINAGYQNQSKNNYWSPAWIAELSRQLEQAQKQFQARLGSGRMYRRLGNGAGVPGLRRSNSLGNLSQQGRGNNRANWRQSNGDLSSNRSVSFGGSTMGRRMRYKRRGMRRNRGVFTQNQGGGGFNRMRRAPPGVGRGGLRRNPGRGRGQARGQGRGRGNYRGRGITRNQTKPLPTREELDQQLEQYMSGTKAALDKQLDEYMQNAMELE